jgi:hypothetical protein
VSFVRQSNCTLQLEFNYLELNHIDIYIMLWYENMLKISCIGVTSWNLSYILMWFVIYILFKIIMIHYVVVLRPAEEFFTYMGASPLLMKSCQILSLCSALRTFEQEFWHEVLVFPDSTKGPLHSIASYDTYEMCRINYNSDPHRFLLILIWQFFLFYI